MAANPFDDPSVTTAASDKQPFANTAYDDSYWDNNGKIGDQNNAYTENNNNNSKNSIANNDYRNSVTNNSSSNKNDKIQSNNYNQSTTKTITSRDLDLREENLIKKEQELKERKSRLDKLEQDVQSDPEYIREDNWPCKFYPIAYHSISEEIPPHARPHMRHMYTLFIFTIITLFWNACTCLAIYFVDAGGNEDMLWSIVYLVSGTFGAWKLWYRQIYYGIRDRKTLRWWLFFFFFIMHICFCIVMSIGFEDIGSAGVIQMFDTFDKDSGAGFCNLVSSILWITLIIGSIFYLKRSWNVYKARGGLEQAKTELTREAIKQTANQSLV